MRRARRPHGPRNRTRQPSRGIPGSVCGARLREPDALVDGAEPHGGELARTTKSIGDVRGSVQRRFGVGYATQNL